MRATLGIAAGAAAAGSLLLASGADAVGDGNDLLPDIPLAGFDVTLELVANTGAPVADIASAGDGSGRLFLVQTDGGVRILQNGSLLPGFFLDEPAYPFLAQTALVFHPDFPADPRVFVVTGEAFPNGSTADYTPPQVDATDGLAVYDNLLLEYEVDPLDPDRVDASTRRELLRIHQPQEFHDVNHLAFGNDGFLYIALGDGGETRAGSPSHYNVNAQDTTNPYGGILRIDVDSIGPNGRYGIPADNPFADGAGGNVPELYAWGLRNPWRIAVDRLTGSIYAGVNGDITIEQIYRVEKGANHGWDQREGSFLWNPVTGEATVDPAPNPAFTAPLAEYDHNGSTQAFGSVIGGPLYRGSRYPAFYGRYIFLDYVAGEIGTMNPSTGDLQLVPQDPAGAQLPPEAAIAWGEDEDGFLYIGGIGGELYRLLEQPAPPVPVLSPARRGLLLVGLALLGILLSRRRPRVAVAG